MKINYYESDPRVLFILMFFASLSVVVLKGEFQLYFLLIMFLVYFIYERFNVLKYFLIACSLYGVSFLVYMYLSHTGFRFIGMFSMIGFRLLPVMMVSSLLFNIPTGSLMAFLYRCHIPLSVRLGVVVALRFFPDAKQQIKYVRNAIKIRHLSLSLLHPIRSFEYLIVPIMHKSLKIATEMSASIMTKGIEFDGIKTSFHVFQYKPLDYMIIGGCLIPFILFFIEVLL